ncbi:ABC transporter substrate-binding protein [Paenibacillus ginsengarvi]|uniref:Extracellular solute-binding protein n=1 Tax=Paenibacillus ginsengarvi TaxID=400777 RepID=A0A3B0CJ19_9BACL|nr:extracellular solute-binding protein [Paenibacillus ginsengarvi]RKN84297.1 extracellular solute-binding protein [Paenibacillus ginsengarvi]
MFKKRTATVLSLSLLAAVTAGCGAKANDGEGNGAAAAKPSEPVEIVFYSSNGDPTESFDYRFGNSIRKKFPNYTIKYIQSAKGSTMPELLTAGTKFDIFFISTGNYESMMFENGLEIDMDELVKKHKVDLSKLEPTVVEGIRQSSGGKLTGIPIHTNNMVLYFNKTLFDKFGVSYPKDGMTWDQMLDIAKKMTRNEGGTQYFGFTTSPNHIMRMNPYSIPNIDLKTQTPTIASNDKWKSFFQNVFLDPFTDAGYKQYLDKANKVPDINSFLKDQNVAMYAYLSSLVYVLPDDLQKVNWDMVSLPTFKDLPGVGSQSYPFYFGITKLSKHPDESMEVLKYMLSDDFQMELSRKGIMPVVKNEAVQNALGQDSPFKDKNFKSVFFNKFAPIPAKAPYDANIVTNYAKYADQVIKQKLDINTAFRQSEEEAVKFIADYKKK